MILIVMVMIKIKTIIIIIKVVMIMLIMVYIYIIYHQISTAQHGLESTAPLNSQDLSRQEIREGAIRKCRFWSKWNPGDINRQ